MLFKVLVETGLEIQLFLSETTMADCKIFVNEFNGEERVWCVKWCCFLDARARTLVQDKMEKNTKPNQPSIGTLPDGLRDYSEGQLAWERSQL